MFGVRQNLTRRSLIVSWCCAARFNLGDRLDPQAQVSPDCRRESLGQYCCKKCSRRGMPILYPRHGVQVTARTRTQSVRRCRYCLQSTARFVLSMTGWAYAQRSGVEQLDRVCRGQCAAEKGQGHDSDASRARTEGKLTFSAAAALKRSAVSWAGIESGSRTTCRDGTEKTIRVHRKAREWAMVCRLHAPLRLDSPAF